MTSRRTPVHAVLSALAFVGLVVAANLLTARFGLVLGGICTAGTFAAGAVLAARDVVREASGRTLVAVCITAGVGVSFAMTFAAGTFPGGPTPIRLAIASAVAFGLAELADFFVYEPLRKSGRLRAAAVSQIPGAIVDSFLFLWLAGFAIWPAAGWQVVVKCAVVLIPLGVIGGGRALLRHRVRTASA